jgi:hypothetical protein
MQCQMGMSVPLTQEHGSHLVLCIQMLEEYVGKELRPSDLIINSGLWGTSLEYLGLEQ